ncbi:head GIN domain-containing protein [uncultured Pontibacter sp.]|uniref:head GIN domain-containing protein n=1 Tax=uncultured Pontibacter sp. TaxID=453356 RepID=UPI0026077923|nr:head GIN domain-containing protein [uncultured Pontibacter sp.]
MKISKFYATPLVITLLLMLVNLPLMAQQLKGNGNMQTQNRNVSGFTGIDVSGGFSVEVTQGNNESLKLEAEENLLDNIKTEVRNGVLHIYNDKSLSSTKGMKAYITVKELNKIDISGGVKVVGKSTFRTNTMALDMSGGSKVTLAVDAKQVKTDMSGASKVELSGKTDELRMEMSGASNVDASGLVAKDVRVGASGASKVKVHADKTLHIDASGASAVYYKGTPSITSETSAAAKISRL